MKQIFRWILFGILALLVVSLLGFVLWGITPQKASLEAMEALISDSQVNVQYASQWITFSPINGNPTKGFIFYPGGHVDYRAYAPLLRQIAAQGYFVALVKMPLSLAVLSPGRASEVIAANAEIQSWAIGGHSLGGAMAANYLYTNPGKVKGLILWASYPAASNDLSSADIHALSVYASLDGLSTGDKIAASRPLLPADTRWVEIAGGNHAGFGSYGLQKGDLSAKISAGEQRQQTVQATVDLLAELD